jgi:hypothetical protein
MFYKDGAPLALPNGMDAFQTLPGSGKEWDAMERVPTRFSPLRAGRPQTKDGAHGVSPEPDVGGLVWPERAKAEVTRPTGHELKILF